MAMTGKKKNPSQKDGLSKIPKLSGDFSFVARYDWEIILRGEKVQLLPNQLFETGWTVNLYFTKQANMGYFTVNLQTTCIGLYWATVHASGLCSTQAFDQGGLLTGSEYVSARLTLRVMPLSSGTLLGMERVSSQRSLLSNQLQLFDNPRYANVAFVFEREGRKLKIYASTEQLQAASEYFSDKSGTVFDSGGFEAGSEGLDADDSDIELDNSSFKAIDACLLLSYKSVVFKNMNREISFRHLRSSKDQLETSLHDSLNIESPPWSKAPVPVSAKSIYRLADEHSILELRKLAEEHTCDSLTDDVINTSAYDRFLEGADIPFSVLAEIMKEKANQAKVV
ncbi:hypothetical protein BT69DRAFT_1293466 [Atractiella rhizophila]|nr:hypothetical protein BT69DRAFT_1293466 [Atractiella rhizophila]